MPISPNARSSASTWASAPPSAGHVPRPSDRSAGEWPGADHRRRLSAIPADNKTGNFTKVVQRVPVRLTIVWGNSPLLGLVRPGMSAIATVLTDGVR